VDAWVAVDPTAVDGAPSAVTEALATLERDGLIERDARSWVRLRTGIP
jgi:Mn-dependent DtxR family transcriptional regulator